MKLNVKDKRAFLAAARGEILNDLALVNGQIVNVFTGEIRKGNVYFSQGLMYQVNLSCLVLLILMCTLKVPC